MGRGTVRQRCGRGCPRALQGAPADLAAAVPESRRRGQPPARLGKYEPNRTGVDVEQTGPFAPGTLDTRFRTCV